MGHTEQVITDAVKGKSTIVVGNTAIQTQNGITSVTLHSSTIMVINHNRRIITLSSCGYKTNITKSRMNLVLDALNINMDIKQIKRKWYLVSHNGEICKEFTDGMYIIY
jgi:hypothetical protein